MRLQQRTAVITGAASGIGRALSLALAGRGVHLALVDKAEAGLAATAAQARHAPIRVSTHVVDLGDRAAVAALPAQLLASHPGIDLLFNNAGVALAGDFEQTDDADMEQLFAVNFWGVVHMTRALLPLLRTSDDARIINVSSIYGLIAPPGTTAYAASKFAVRGFSEALAGELARSSVGVTIVLPGGTATGIARNITVSAAVPAAEAERLRQTAARFLKLPPDRAAATIVRGVERRRAQVLVGRDAQLISWVQRAFPVWHLRPILWLMARA